MVRESLGTHGESRLIRAIEALWAGREHPSVALAGGDDCAVLRLPGSDNDLLLTSDQVVEGRHFLRGRHGPEALGWKALVRSLSDIAAMGGHPSFCLQTVSLPGWASGEWHMAFQRGMRRAAELAGARDLALVGGDVSEGERFVATVTVIGTVESGTALLRSGARPGDLLYVSGSLGGSLLGLRKLLGPASPGDADPAVRRHCEPLPRLGLGSALRSLPATSAIDLSDSLADAASHLATASAASIVMERQALPLYPGADPAIALSSGEEYELLCTLAPATPPPPDADLTRIGFVKRGSGVWLRSERGIAPVDQGGQSERSASD